MSKTIQHYLNPRHVYCRLRNLALTKEAAIFLCRLYKRTVFNYLLRKTPIFFCALCISGCVSMHSKNVQKAQDGDRLSVANVQREVRKGMSGAEVIEVLGSPNIVSTDENGWEVWVYDKISTDVSYSRSSAGIIGLIFGGSGGGLGGGELSSGAASKSQRTLTVIIKFDENKKVRDFAYHTSRF